MLPAEEVRAARYGPSRRERAASFVLALLTSVLLLLILIAMSGYQQFGGDAGGHLVAVNLSGPAAEKAMAKAAPTKDVKTPETQQTVTPPKMPPRVVVPSKNQVEWPPGFIHLSRDELAKADISKIKPSGGGGAAGGTAGGGGSAEGAGSGPGGAKVYNAEWYREPTRAELSPYMGAARGGGNGEWAMIVCRTIERFHVEDCRELDESPRGSGLARALRQAAWQFLVRPPRVDGKSQIGTWVSIRFTFRSDKREDAAVGAGTGDAE